jgi:hypothetical protein
MIAGLVAALVAATSLAACATSGDPPSQSSDIARERSTASRAAPTRPRQSIPTTSRVSPSLTAAQVLVEYRRERRSLVLAPGWHWHRHPSIATVGPDGDPMYYELGYGRAAADHHWFCSWTQRLVSTAPGSSQRDRAYSTLRRVRRLFYYRVALVPMDRHVLDGLLERVGRGDVAPIARDFALNCSREQTSL